MKKKYWLPLALLIFLILAFWSNRTERVIDNEIEINAIKQNLLKNENLNQVPDIAVHPVNTTCKNSRLILILVTSYVGHVELRSAHRRAMSKEYMDKYNTERIFLLAQIPPSEQSITQQSVESENKIYGDILQGSFTENYRNLTYKHLMGLDWAASHCNKTKYILKVDDDSVFNLERTYNQLNNMKYDKLLLQGYMLNNTKPRREKQNKWYVTKEEYSEDMYPSYLSGWYYITNPYTAQLIVNAAKQFKYFWVDDVLITGYIPHKLNIKRTSLPENYFLESYELLECCLRDMILKNIKCNYAIGPNGGRNNLIYEFNKAIEVCDKSKICVKQRQESLKKTCVAFRDRLILSDGQSDVKSIKL